MNKKILIDVSKGILGQKLIHLLKDEDDVLTQACKLAIDKETKCIYNVFGKDILNIYEMFEPMTYFYSSDISKINRTSSFTSNQKAKRLLKTDFNSDKTINAINCQPHSIEESLAFLEKQIN